MANDIVCENSKPGTPSASWAISGVGDSSIQGFATDISVNQGQTVFFKIKTDAASYHLDIYRMGYYGGNGARLITTVNPSAALPQNQPACITDSATKLYDCGNWAVSASWAVPANATSGIYFARVIRTDTGGASHIFFIVRNDASHSDVLYQTSDETWQAYNNYGGNSLYGGLGTFNDANRAYKVSYNRPFNTEAFAPVTWLFSEYPMVRWLEANGYDVTYFTDIDSDRSGSLIQNHKVFLSSGHDEYWSGPLAHQRRSRPRCRCKPGVFQRQRGLLEDSLGDQHRWFRHALPHAGLLQGDAGRSSDRSDGAGDVDGHLARSEVQSSRRWRPARKCVDGHNLRSEWRRSRQRRAFH